MYGPKCDTPHYNRTINRMEFTAIRQFYRLRESVGQLRKRKLMEIFKTLWYPREDREHYTQLLQRHVQQSCT